MTHTSNKSKEVVAGVGLGRAVVVLGNAEEHCHEAGGGGLVMHTG